MLAVGRGRGVKMGVHDSMLAIMNTVFANQRTYDDLKLTTAASLASPKNKSRKGRFHYNYNIVSTKYKEKAADRMSAVLANSTMRTRTNATDELSYPEAKNMKVVPLVSSASAGGATPLSKYGYSISTRMIDRNPVQFTNTPISEILISAISDPEVQALMIQNLKQMNLVNGNPATRVSKDVTEFINITGKQFHLLMKGTGLEEQAK